MASGPWNSVISDDDRKASADALEEGTAHREREEAHAARKDFLRHPVYKTLMSVQAGEIFNGLELDALRLGARNRAQLDSSIATLTEMRDRGEFGKAQDEAHELAAKVVDSLPEVQQVSTYLDEKELDERGPAELAEAVTAW
jgi:hypothetical protein